MSLHTRLARLEAVTPDPGPSPEDQRWLDTWRWAVGMVLENMPRERALAVAAELQADTPYAQQSPITRRVVSLALTAVPGSSGLHAVEAAVCECSVHYGGNAPLCLPEVVCRVLEAHPDASFGAYTCERCGYPPGEQGHYGDPLLEICPVPGCGGPVSRYGFDVAHHYRMRTARRERVERDPAWAARFGLVPEKYN